ncbi:STAS domain-containing protein [Kitasatospora paranensis]|uniref:STAS domain-containing protein n=2 Tax=Kitasatospora paranensis TaxID=258053 RepID=A0ABW2GBX3_9ACTN
MTVAGQVDPPSFRVLPRPGQGAPVLEAAGELDQVTGPLLDVAVTDVLDGVAAAGALVLDISGVEFCDSGGLNAVIRAHLRSREAAAVLQLVSPTGQVAALLRRTGVGRVLQVSSGGCPPSLAVRPGADAERPA